MGSKGEVIQFTPREGRFAHTIRQEEIEELLQRSRDLTEARQRYIELRDYLKAALRGGAVIESGAYEPELRCLIRQEYSVRATTVERLFVHNR